MFNLVTGVVGSILATILCSLAWASYRHYRKGRGLFVGTWDQVIPAVNDQPAKRDVVVCSQHGERVSGQIARIEPTTENSKRWSFQGRVRENVLAAIFWSEDPGINSFGTMLLVHSGDHRYDGYYTKHRLAEQDIDHIAEERERIHFHWLKRPAPGTSPA